MPFDGLTETPAIRRARLIEALREPMPARFEWDFCNIVSITKCGTAGCALGLANVIWPGAIGRLCNATVVGEFFGVTANDVDLVFYDCSIGELDRPYPRWLRRDEITPAMVADALEKIDQT